MTKRKGPPKGIVWHHSLTKDGSTKDWASIRNHHMNHPDYMMDDIGYHFGIERINGEIVFHDGRPQDMIGGHTRGYNDMLGVCIVGNFDLAPPDAELFEAVVCLAKNLLAINPHLTISDNHKHSEYASKSCPGNKFPWYEFINAIKL